MHRDQYQKYNDKLDTNCTLDKNNKYNYCDLNTYNILSNKDNKYPESEIVNWLKKCYNNNVTSIGLTDKDGKLVEKGTGPISCSAMNDNNPQCNSSKVVPQSLSLVDNKMKYFAPYVKKLSSENEVCCGGWGTFLGDDTTKDKSVNFQDIKSTSKDPFASGAAAKIQIKCDNYCKCEIISKFK